MNARSLLTGLCLMAALVCLSGCVSQRQLIYTDLPEDISPEELSDELQSTNRLNSSVGVAILSGVVGLLAGAGIGGGIGKNTSGEDAGLEGVMTGAMFGLASGLFLGSVLGWNAGAKKDRREAIERIRQRRGTGSLGIRMSDHPSLAGCERQITADYFQRDRATRQNGRLHPTEGASVSAVCNVVDTTAFRKIGAVLGR